LRGLRRRRYSPERLGPAENAEPAERQEGRHDKRADRIDVEKD